MERKRLTEEPPPGEGDSASEWEAPGSAGELPPQGPVFHTLEGNRARMLAALRERNTATLCGLPLPLSAPEGGAAS